MLGRHRWSAALVSAAAVVTLVGCGGSSGGGSPKADLLSGVDGLANASRLTTTIKLDTTAQTLQTLSQSSSSPLDANIASVIAGSQIVVETVRGGGGTDLDLRGLANGSTLVELRSVGGTLYLQGNVRGIFTLINKKSLYGNLRGQTKSMPSFVQAAVAGKWVSIPGSALSSLASLTGGSSSSSAPNKGPKVIADLRHAIDQDVTATKAGTDSRGTHYVLHADEKALAADLRSTLQDAVPGGSALSSRVPSNVSHQTVTFDAWVRSGALTELSINLLQFGDTSKVPAGTTLPLTITFVRTGADIPTPSGATPVDLTQLGTLVGALQGGG